jgi:hypothetical protein
MAAKLDEQGQETVRLPFATKPTRATGLIHVSFRSAAENGLTIVTLGKATLAYAAPAITGRLLPSSSRSPRD